MWHATTLLQEMIGWNYQACIWGEYGYYVVDSQNDTIDSRL